MASKKHSSDQLNLKKPYEENEIGLKGILWFGVGLFLLIVVTFGLMWVLLYLVLPPLDMNAGSPRNPMAMSDKERLPPEPRLQLAPGFGVDSQKGRVNLELLEPSAEYREVHSQWLDLWAHGQKDPKTGTVTVMPINQAILELLEHRPKARMDAAAEEYLERSRTFISDASSGRVPGERRR